MIMASIIRGTQNSAAERASYCDTMTIILINSSAGSTWQTVDWTTELFDLNLN